MEFFLSTQLSIPLYLFMLLLALTTTALLLGRNRLALLMIYVFTMYLGYVHNGISVNKVTIFTIIYFVFGLATLLLAAIGFFVDQSQSYRENLY